MGTALIRYAARSDKGCIRRNNEDNLFFCGRYLTSSELSHPFGVDGECPFPAIFGVFDGIGGEQCGEFASMIAAQTLTAYEPQLLSDLGTEPRGCLQTQAIQMRMAASRATAKNRQARFSYLVAKRRLFLSLRNKFSTRWRSI